MFVNKGMKPIAIKPIDDNLEDEDLIEMVSAGLLPYAVVDDHEATIWTEIFPNAIPRADLIVGEGGEIAWAVRKNSPELKAELNAFFSNHSRHELRRHDPKALFLRQAGREECSRTERSQKISCGHRPLSSLRRTVQFRLSDDRRSGLPGIRARPDALRSFRGSAPNADKALDRGCRTELHHWGGP